jgi:hypothetical protein
MTARVQRASSDPCGAILSFTSIDKGESRRHY